MNTLPTHSTPVPVGSVREHQRFTVVGDDSGLVYRAHSDAHWCGSLDCSCDHRQGRVYCLHSAPIAEPFPRTRDYGHFAPSTMVMIRLPLLEELAAKLVPIESLAIGQKFHAYPEELPASVYEIVLTAHACGDNPCNCTKSNYYRPACVHVRSQLGDVRPWHAPAGTRLLPYQS